MPKISRLRFLPRTLRRRKTRRAARAWFIVIGIVVAAAGLVYNNMQTRIDPTAYTQLLNTIAKGESNGNYNAYFNNPGNSSIRFTDMTVGEVLKWQQDYISQGSFSSAVGRYQFVRPTLAGLVKQLKLDPQARFDETLQDRLAITLMERRGAVDYVEQKLTREQFAANLAKEWAALPRVIGGNPEESYYAKDGVNKSRVSIDEVYRALASLEA